MKQVGLSFWKRITGGRREQQALALLRIAAGLFFLYEGYQKLINPHFADALGATLRHWASSNPFPLYQQFLSHVAIPYASIFAKLVLYGEIAVGLSFISGFLVQISAPAAILMNANYLLASQHTGPASLGVNLAFIFISVALFWGRAGQHYGLDQWDIVRFFSIQNRGISRSKASKKLKASRNLIEKGQKGVTSSGKAGQKGKNKSRLKSKPFE